MIQQGTTNELQLLLKALGYFRTHWWAFILEAIVVFGGGLYLFHHTPPVYESHASLLIDTSRHQLYQSVIGPGSYIQNGSRRTNMANLLASHDVMERMRAQLTDLYNANGRPAHLRPLFPGGAAVGAEFLHDLVSLAWDKNSDVYGVVCHASDQDAAHDLCLSYLNAVQNYYPEIGQREQMLKDEFLRREIKSVTAQVGEHEQAVTDFQRKNNEFSTYITLDLGDKGLRDLHLQEHNLKEKIAINRAIRDLLLRSRFSKSGPVNGIETTLTALNTRLADMQYQRQLANESPDPNNPQRIQSLDRDIAKVTDQIAKLNELEMKSSVNDPIPAQEIRKRVSDLEVDYRTDQVKLQGVFSEIASTQEQNKRFQQKRLEYERLVHELEHNRHLLTQLYEKEQELQLELSAGNAEIFRLEEPSASGVRISPKLTKSLFSSLSITIFLIIVTLGLMLALMPRLDSETEVNRLNLPVLGKVPAMARTALNMEQEGSFGFEYAKIINYRILRETKDQKCPIVIVSSANPREGKSTLSQLLCLASRGPDRKALLIDGDLLTYNHNCLFGVQEDATSGVKSLLDHTAPADWKALIVKTPHDGISFMPRGDRVEPSVMPNFLEPVKGFLETARKEYDIIFIDTPPLFQSNLAHQWSGIADLIVLVARLFYTRPRDILEAMQTVKIFSKAPVGTVLNCVPMGSLQRRASHYYYFSRRKTKPKLAA